MAYSKPPVNQHPFLAGGGTMGELIRNFNWEDTELGDPELWPQALKISVGIILRSPFPMHITWGENFIQFYNDGYRPILGSLKHPDALGNPIAGSFPEIWDTVGPMFLEVMQGGQVRIQDFKLFLDRNGFPEECYFDFAYSPIPDEGGIICGVLTNVLETTAKVTTVRELEEAQEELRASQAHITRERDRLMQFFMESPVGICILTGSKLRFEMVNPLYQQLFPGRELLNRAILEAIPELTGSPIIEILDRVLLTGVTYQGIDELVPIARTDTGAVEDRYFDFTYQARLDSIGRTIGILVFAIEVTDRKLTELRKNDFITIVSHELKTPLTSLNAIVQLATSRLKKTVPVDDQLIGAMDRATGQVKRMGKMINGFLNLSRLESAEIHLEKEMLDFTSLVIEAMEELQMTSRGHELIMDCRDSHLVVADREKIISVITNLMANAVKYSPIGGRVEMNCSSRDGALVFSVSDSGIGIDSHDLDRIFERFYRVSAQETRNISGFGIGLYLSAEIVQLHGGKIWAESEFGKGSTFYCSLPLLS